MIKIIDYNVGNIGSIENMLRKISTPCKIVNNPFELESASGIILPGVGKFDYGINQLIELGFFDKLNEIVKEKNIPFLGICLGAQILCNSSEEGKLSGLGWIDAEVVKFNALPSPLKVPHMGWNTVVPLKENKLLTHFKGIPKFYFVHSYHIRCRHTEEVLGETKYGIPFHSAIGVGNIFGVQFHPEKSHKFGFQLLKNFSDIVQHHS